MDLGELNRGERAIVDRMAGGHPKEATIRAQLMAARVSLRQRTGHGFYTYLNVLRDPSHVLSSSRPVANAWAHVKGLELGMTFLLWTDSEGFVECIEGAGFGEDVDAIDFGSVAIEFYDVPEGHFSGFRPPPPSWRKH